MNMHSVCPTRVIPSFITDNFKIQRMNQLTIDLCNKENHLFALLSLVLREAIHVSS